MRLLGADSDIQVAPSFDPRSFVHVEQMTTKAQLSFNICVLSKDYVRAKVFSEQLEVLNRQYRSPVSALLSGRGWQPLMLAALMHEGLGELEQALKLLQRAADLAEHHREGLLDSAVRLSSFGQHDVASIFVTASRLCLQIDANKLETHDKETVPSYRSATWPEEALFFLEQGKARYLLDAITKELDSGTSSSMKEWHELSQNVSTSTPAIRSERAVRMRKIQEGIQTTTPVSKFYFLIRNFSKIEYQLIGPKTLIIELGVSDDLLVIICMDTAGVIQTAMSRVTAWDIQSNVGLLRRNIALPKSGSTRAQSRVQRSVEFLSRAIIEPIKQCISNKEHIVFVPSSSLARFPFGLLQLNGISLSPLYTVTECPSLLTFLQLSKLDRPITQASFITNPSFSGGEEHQIPGSYFESVYIAKKISSSIYLSSEMNESSLQDIVTHSDLLHLAAHGHLDHDQPLRSSIMLDPPFTVEDLSKISCHANLVVFASCFSGLGRVTFGEDLLGFSHAVLSSGAKAFIGTLWKVDDITSMIFMILFYKALTGYETTCSLSPALAVKKAIAELIEMDLRSRNSLIKDIIATIEEHEITQSGTVHPDSKRKLMAALHEVRDFTDPWYWAPFVLIGHGY